MGHEWSDGDPVSRRKGGGSGGLRGLARQLHELQKTVAIDVAKRAAPAITGLVQAAFAAGETVYGSSRPLGSHGNALDLVETGKARAALMFTNDGGTRVRAVLGEKYMGYLIGKYEILPRGGLTHPDDWWDAIDAIAKDEIAKRVEELG